MTRTSICFKAWLIGALWIGCGGAPRIDAADAVEQSAEQATSPVDAKIDVFNGKDLTGFYTWLADTKYDDPKAVFRVTDGLLHITGDGYGSLTTERAYQDYRLVLEYRWGEKTWGERREKARDSGLLFHSHGADGEFGGAWMPSIEANIIEGGVGDFILVKGNEATEQVRPVSLTSHVNRDRDGEIVWDPDGDLETFNAQNWHRVNWQRRDPDWKDVKGFRGKDDVDNLGDEWTRLEVVCDAGHIQVYVNGELVNEAFDCSPRSGKLQLQTEGAEVFVRRWELWPLAEESPASAK